MGSGERRKERENMIIGELKRISADKEADSGTFDYGQIKKQERLVEALVGMPTREIHQLINSKSRRVSSTRLKHH